MDVGIIYLSFFISSARNSYWLLNNSSSDAAPIESGNVVVMCEPVPEDTQPLFPRIVLRIRQAPNTVVGVGIGVGAVRVGECRLGNVPVPTRVRARLLGGGVAQGFTEQVVPIVGRTDSSRPAMNVVIE